MSFCSEYVLEEIQNCYNISKCLPSTKEGFLAKKIRKLVKVSISNSLFYYLLFLKKIGVNLVLYEKNWCWYFKSNLLDLVANCRPIGT